MAHKKLQGSTTHTLKEKSLSNERRNWITLHTSRIWRREFWGNSGFKTADLIPNYKDKVGKWERGRNNDYKIIPLQL